MASVMSSPVTPKATRPGLGVSTTDESCSSLMMGSTGGRSCFSPAQALRLPALAEPELEASKECADVRMWDMERVAEWLRQIGHSDYTDGFAEARVDGLFLLQLQESDFYDLGVTNKLHRQHLALRVKDLLRPTATQLTLAKQQVRLMKAELDAVRLVMKHCGQRDTEVRQATMEINRRKGHQGDFKRVHVIQSRYIIESLSEPFAKDVMMWTCCGSKNSVSDKCLAPEQRTAALSPESMSQREYNLHHSPYIVHRYEVCQSFPKPCLWASAERDVSGLHVVPGCNIAGQHCSHENCGGLQYP